MVGEILGFLEEKGLYGCWNGCRMFVAAVLTGSHLATLDIHHSHPDLLWLLCSKGPLATTLTPHLLANVIRAGEKSEVTRFGVWRYELFIWCLYMPSVTFTALSLVSFCYSRFFKTWLILYCSFDQTKCFATVHTDKKIAVSTANIKHASRLAVRRRCWLRVMSLSVFVETGFAFFTIYTVSRLAGVASCCVV